MIKIEHQLNNIFNILKSETLLEHHDDFISNILEIHLNDYLGKLKTNLESNDLYKIEKYLSDNLNKQVKDIQYVSVFESSKEKKEREKLFNYFYWKYPLISNSGNIQKKHFSRYMSILGIYLDIYFPGVHSRGEVLDTIIKPMHGHTVCTTCNQQAEFLLSDLSGKIITINCPKCGHQDKIETTNPLQKLKLSDCQCKKCVDKRNSFFKKFRQESDRVLDELALEISERYNSYDDLNDHEDMLNRKHYRLYANYLSDIEKYIILKKPKDITDIYKTIQYIYDNKTVSRSNVSLNMVVHKNQIFDNLLKHRVIYLKPFKDETSHELALKAIVKSMKKCVKTCNHDLEKKDIRKCKKNNSAICSNYELEEAAINIADIIFFGNQNTFFKNLISSDESLLSIRTETPKKNLAQLKNATYYIEEISPILTNVEDILSTKKYELNNYYFE